jgi:hypothetical protein
LPRERYRPAATARGRPRERYFAVVCAAAEPGKVPERRRLAEVLFGPRRAFVLSSGCRLGSRVAPALVLGLPRPKIGEEVMTRASRSLSILLVLPLVACGGGPAGPETGGGATPTPAPRCRHYATSLTVSTTLEVPGGSNAWTEAMNCAFDAAARVLRCESALTSGIGCQSLVSTKTYPSVTDFVEEAEAIGRSRYAVEEIVQSGGCTSHAVHTITYDAQKRPILLQSSTATGLFEASYNAWDLRGRPTLETWTGRSCDGAMVAWTYDDAAGRATSTVTSSGEGNACTVGATTTLAYDGAGNLVSYLNAAPGFTFARNSIVNATAMVCF